MCDKHADVLAQLEQDTSLTFAELATARMASAVDRTTPGVEAKPETSLVVNRQTGEEHPAMPDTH